MIVDRGNALSKSSIGKLTLTTHQKPLHLKDILIVPQLTSNLLSVAKFVKDNYCLIEFNPLGCIVMDFRTRIPLLAGRIHNNLHPLNIPPALQNHVAFATHQVSSDIVSASWSSMPICYV